MAGYLIQIRKLIPNKRFQGKYLRQYNKTLFELGIVFENLDWAYEYQNGSESENLPERIFKNVFIFALDHFPIQISPLYLLKSLRWERLCLSSVEQN